MSAIKNDSTNIQSGYPFGDEQDDYKLGVIRDAAYKWAFHFDSQSDPDLNTGFLSGWKGMFHTTPHGADTPALMLVYEGTAVAHFGALCLRLGILEATGDGPAVFAIRAICLRGDLGVRPAIIVKDDGTDIMSLVESSAADMVGLHTPYDQSIPIPKPVRGA